MLMGVGNLWVGEGNERRGREVVIEGGIGEGLCGKRKLGLEDWCVFVWKGKKDAGCREIWR